MLDTPNHRYIAHPESCLTIDDSSGSLSSGFIQRNSILHASSVTGFGAGQLGRHLKYGGKRRFMNRGDKSVFAWLDNIRARPAMYLRNNSLQDLEQLVSGYYAALNTHGLVEAVPHMTGHFSSWLSFRKGWSLSLGWAVAFDRTHSAPEHRLASFFKEVDEYRTLTLTKICTVKLVAQHNPTGKRVKIGLDGLIEKPLRVDVVRYRPEPLHFLRFHYRGRVVDHDLLMTSNGQYNTSVSYAKGWVRDELQVKFRDWEKVQA